MRLTKYGKANFRALIEAENFDYLVRESERLDTPVTVILDSLVSSFIKNQEQNKQDFEVAVEEARQQYQNRQ